ADATTSDSGTTVQVAGVDEADIAKRVGDLLLVLGQGTGGQSLQILRTASDGTAGPVGRLATDWSPTGMLVERGTVLLVGTAAMSYPAGAADRMMPIGVERTRIDEIDISDPARPRRVRSMMLDGSASGARMVDGVVRVALTSWPRLRFDTRPVWGGPVPLAESGITPTAIPRPGPSTTPGTEPTEAELTERNRTTVRDSTIEDWLPRYDLTQTDGSQTSGPLVDCADVAAPSERAGVNTLTLLSIDLREGGLSSWRSSAVVASGSTVYATADRTVLATPSNPFAVIRAPGPAVTTTQLHVFDTSGRGTARYLAGGEVEGSLLNQFSLDLHDGALRVATTDQTQSRVSVLRQSGKRLVVAGTVDGLGTGERIFAVRFAGPIGYVVTFRQTDPLYTLDLSDPAHPRMVGELKIRGYSAYLQPAGDGRLLGVGQDADASGRVKGLQMSLFDVSDLAAPHRISQITLPQAFSDAESDHHAFTLADGLALLPYRGNGMTGSTEGGLAAVRVGDTTLDGPTLLPSRHGNDVPLRTFVGDGIIWAVGQAGVASYDQDTLQARGFTAWQ
ncbi:MAG: beta-propeller domain-containing protein, partial [Kineosporiaceae bacterium]